MEMTGVSLSSRKGTGEFLWSIFYIFEIKLFCFVAAMSDLVHNVETMHGLR